jgi:hypothetical protein
MFLKMDSFFLEPGEQATIWLYNGTFLKSENVISRDRMQDVSILSPDGRQRQSEDQWREKGNVTLLNFETGKSGTYIAGVSTRPRIIELSAKDFNDYLRHDGVLDILDLRKKKGQLDQEASERYSKHVKAILQVGDQKTDDYHIALGYPIEFIPVSNPYGMQKGQTLQVRLLLRNKPLANQLVYAGYNPEEHSHTHDEDHSHDSEMKLETDKQGIVNLTLAENGHWYLRTIYMEETDTADTDYESNWATLTFEIR